MYKIAWICVNPDGVITRHHPDKCNSYSIWHHVSRNDHWRLPRIDIYHGHSVRPNMLNMMGAYRAIIVNAHPSRAYSMLNRLKAVYPRKPVAIVHDNNPYALRDGSETMYKAYNACDIIIGYRRSHERLIANVCDTPFIYVPAPYPSDWNNQYDPVRHYNSHNYVVMYSRYLLYISEVLHRVDPGCIIHVFEPATSFRKVARNKKMIMRQSGVKVDWHVDIQQREFMEILRRGHVGIFHDEIGYLGRFATECAVLGMPCLGTTYTERQKILFKDLTMDPASFLKDLPAQLRALRERRYYDIIANKAYDAVGAEYSVRRCVELMRKFVDMIPQLSG